MTNDYDIEKGKLLILLFNNIKQSKLLKMKFYMIKIIKLLFLCVGIYILYLIIDKININNYLCIYVNYDEYYNLYNYLCISKLINIIVFILLLLKPIVILYDLIFYTIITNLIKWLFIIWIIHDFIILYFYLYDDIKKYCSNTTKNILILIFIIKIITYLYKYNNTKISLGYKNKI